MNIIIGIIIGIVVWNTFVLIVGLITDFDNETANTCLCGVWGILFVVLLKPICLAIRTIRLHKFYKKFHRYNLIKNGKSIGLSYFIDKDIISNFETDESKPFYLKEYPKQKYHSLPYRSEIITKARYEHDQIPGMTSDDFNKWLKVD